MRRRDLPISFRAAWQPSESCYTLRRVVLTERNAWNSLRLSAAPRLPPTPYPAFAPSDDVQLRRGSALCRLTRSCNTERRAGLAPSPRRATPDRAGLLCRRVNDWNCVHTVQALCSSVAGDYVYIRVPLIVCVWWVIMQCEDVSATCAHLRSRRGATPFFFLNVFVCAQQTVWTRAIQEENGRKEGRTPRPVPMDATPRDLAIALAVAQGCPKIERVEGIYQRDFVPCTHDVWATLDGARAWTAADFPAGHRINIGPAAVSEFTIFRAPQPLNSLLQRGALTMSLAPGDNAAFHMMLNASIAHIQHRGEAVARELLIPWLGQLAGLAYFPTIHWDTDWLQFPTAPGFQIWCMVHPHPRHTEPSNQPVRAMPGEGGVFLVTSPELSAHDPPVRFVWNEDGTMSKLRHTEDRPEYPLKGYEQASSANLTFHYMDLDAGDCLLWSKRTLHLSDPRPHMRGGGNERVAAHLRVSARERPHGAIDYWPNHPYTAYVGSMPWRLRQQSRSMSRKGGYHQLFVKGDELIERNPTNLLRRR